MISCPIFGVHYKVLEIARKWARKAFAYYSQAPIWVQPVEANGKQWVFVTTYQLRLAVPGTLPKEFRLDANALPKPLKGELIHEGEAYFLVHKGTKKLLPAMSVEDWQEEAKPDGVLHRYLTPNTLRPKTALTFGAEELKAILVMRSKDHARPVLTGVGFHPNGAMAASDGYRLAVSRSEPFSLEEQLGIIFPDAFSTTFARAMIGQLRLTIYESENALQGELRGFLKVGKERAPFLMWVEANNAYPDFEMIAKNAQSRVLAEEVVLPAEWPSPLKEATAHLVGDPINQVVWVIVQAEGATVAVSSMSANVFEWFWIVANSSFLKDLRHIFQEPVNLTTSAQAQFPLTSPFCFARAGREVVIMPMNANASMWDGLAATVKENFGITLPEPPRVDADTQTAFQPEPAYA